MGAAWRRPPGVTPSGGSLSPEVRAPAPDLRSSGHNPARGSLQNGMSRRSTLLSSVDFFFLARLSGWSQPCADWHSGSQRMGPLSCRDQKAQSPSSLSRSLETLDKSNLKLCRRVQGGTGLRPGALRRPQVHLLPQGS